MSKKLSSSSIRIYLFDQPDRFFQYSVLTIIPLSLKYDHMGHFSVKMTIIFQILLKASSLHSLHLNFSYSMGYFSHMLFLLAHCLICFIVHLHNFIYLSIKSYPVNFGRITLNALKVQT